MNGNENEESFRIPPPQQASSDDLTPALPFHITYLDVDALLFGHPRSHCEDLRPLHELEITHGRELKGHVLERLSRAVGDGDVQQDIVLVHVDDGLDEERVGETGQGENLGGGEGRRELGSVRQRGYNLRCMCCIARIISKGRRRCYNS